jgi:hypothetical protein
MAVLDEENVSTSPRGGGPLAFLFRSCNPDPKGSVHRAWSVTMLLTLIFFILAIIEGKPIFFADHVSTELIIANTLSLPPTTYQLHI